MLRISKSVLLVFLFILPTVSGCEHFALKAYSRFVFAHVNPYDFGNTEIDKALNPYLNGSLHWQPHILETEPKKLKAVLIDLIKSDQLESELDKLGGLCVTSGSKHICNLKKQVSSLLPDEDGLGDSVYQIHTLDIQFSYVHNYLEIDLSIDIYKVTNGRALLPNWSFK